MKEVKGKNDVVAKVLIHLPTEPEVSFECPLMFKLPEVGQTLDIAYKKFITDPVQWEIVKNTVENEVMVIARVVGEHVYLRDGHPVN